MIFYVEKIRNGWVVQGGLTNPPRSPLYFGEREFCADGAVVAEQLAKIIAEVDAPKPPTEPAQQ